MPLDIVEISEANEEVDCIMATIEIVFAEQAIVPIVAGVSPKPRSPNTPNG